MICLHNFLVERGNVQLQVGPGEVIPPQGLQAPNNLANPHAHRAAQEAVGVRNTLKDFFVGPGALDYQDDMI